MYKQYLKRVLNIFEYRNGQEDRLLVKKIRSIYGDKPVYLLNNARSAQYIFLKSLNLNKSDNVVVQSFTCNAVVNPILWLDVEVRYSDINKETYSSSLSEIKKKVDRNTKVIVIQHTFGIPAKYGEIVEFAKRNNIIVLEDCAHAFGNGNLGINGDASILSFGIEKVLSTRVGGALVVNNPKINKAIEKEYEKIGKMNYIETFLWLLNPLIWSVLRSFGSFKFKIAKIFKNLGLLNMGFFSSELVGRKPRAYPKKLSNALCGVVNDEIKGIGENLGGRRKCVALYNQKLGGTYGDIAMVRYPYLAKNVTNANEIMKICKQKGLAVGDWYNPVIYPSSTNLLAMGYVVSSCPVSESISSRIVNFPTGKGVGRELIELYCNIVNSVEKDSEK